MGLDQYLVAQKKDPDSSEILSEQLCYWRKHANLQGYMQSLAVEKGIVENVEQFNQVLLNLEMKDLDKVREAIKSRSLPLTSGFFFGASYGDQSELEEDLIAFDEAESYLRMGWSIFYHCWW